MTASEPRPSDPGANPAPSAPLAPLALSPASTEASGLSPTAGPSSNYYDPRRVAMRVSMGVSFLMLSGKLGAFFITGSTAIFSDAAESIIHIAATGIATFALWYSLQPATKSHPYGHGKIAFFSAGFEGALIMSAAVAIIVYGIEALIRGPELRSLDIGVLITFVLACVNLWLGLYLVWAGKKHGSLVLVANGQHVLTDMWTSMGVVIGVGIVAVTNVLWIDPVCAILVGSNILWTAFTLIWRSYQGLMDTAETTANHEIVACLKQAVSEGLVSDFHQLRHREGNNDAWIEVHFLLPGALSLHEAHRRVTIVESRLEALFPKQRIVVTSHIEPRDHGLAHPKGHPGVEDPLTST